jgi:ornithine cyclodeaminase
LELYDDITGSEVGQMAWEKRGMQDVIVEDVVRDSVFSGLISIDGPALGRFISTDDAISLVDAAMRTTVDAGTHAPERWAMPVSKTGRMGIMPGASAALGRFGIKVLGLYGAGQRGDRPSHQGVMLLFDLANGQPLCSVEANALTSLRTAAASAVATRALSRPESSSLTILGCGEQARLHIEAICRIRPITEVRLWNRTEAKARAFARAHLADLPADVRVYGSAAQAVKGADIICTLTGSAKPILFGRDLEPGQHINLVGSSVRGPSEVDDEVVVRARYIADSREHALSQGAELRNAISSGRVGEDHLLGEIGEVLLGQVKGRVASSDITLYKSLGHIVQDLAVADGAHRRWQHDMQTND